ncbi:MAG TPA: hypothetical protein VGB51_06470 [Actinomycetota bacterium]
MRPRLALSAASLLAVLAVSLPTSAITPSGFDCGPDDARDRVTPAGYTRTFTAPEGRWTGHDLAETGGVMYPPVLKEHSTAHFLLRAYLAPYRYGDLDIRLSWAGDGDFDLYVLDAEGTELDSSVAFNPLDGNGERVELAEVAHCTDLEVLVNNYAGQSDEQLTLSVAFKNAGPQFACEEEDPHPACEGKLAGEAPAPVPDTRTRLYLGGDRPGQASMVGHYANGVAGGGLPPTPTARLTETRPVGGESNHYTHAAGGFRNQNSQGLQAHFTTGVAQPTEIKGDVYSTVWVSSETLKGVHDNPPGKLYVQLWSDSFGEEASETTLLGQVIVPGTQIGSAPTRISVVFEDLPAVTIEQELTLQVATDPVATSGGAVGNPSDAQWTVYYDSVQFPSFIALDLPAGSLPQG